MKGEESVKHIFIDKDYELWWLLAQVREVLYKARQKVGIGSRAPHTRWWYVQFHVSPVSPLILL